MKSSFEEVGAVSSTDVLSALGAVGRGAVSGTVRFSGPAGEAIVYGFEEGVLVALETPPENAPAEILLRAGKVQRPTYEALTVGDFEDRFAVAAASGVISKKEANWGMKISAIESLARVLSWTDGAYLFEEGRPAPTAPPLRLAIDHWILELFLRSNDRGFVLRQAGATDIAIAHTPAFATGFSSLGLTADADAVVEAIDGKRSIEQIVKRSRADEFATLKLLAALVTLGLIRPVLETPIDAPPEASGDADRAPGAAGLGESAEHDAALGISEALPTSASSEAAPEWSPETLPWEPEPIPPEQRREPAIVDGEIAETPASALEFEPASAPEDEGPVEEPPRPSREIPSLPLFALTAPEPETVDDGISGIAIEPSIEGDVGPTPRARWPWVAAAAGVAILAATLVLRRTAAGPGREGAPEPAGVAAPARSMPSRGGATASASPAAPSPGSVPSFSSPASSNPPAAARANAAAAASSNPAAAHRPNPPAPVRSRRDAVAAPRPEARRPDPSTRHWRDLAEAGRRKFDHPGRHRYAIQLELACEPGTLEKAFAADRGSNRIWLAPYSFRGRPCYRVLWGRFADLSSAKSAKRDIPAMFSGDGNRPAIVALGRSGGTPPKRARAR